VTGGPRHAAVSGTWEALYRRRWQYDKKVRSTHGVNCTGSCSWDVYVKDGILVWETQATDYPACGEGYPNHEPRGLPARRHLLLVHLQPGAD
jgi:nitrate reductase alpha subunit